MFELKLSLDPAKLDNRYHHLSHVEAINLFDLARTELLKKVGQPLEAFVDRGFFLVVTQVQARFRREIQGTEVRVTCDAVEISGRGITIKQRIINAAGEDAVTAEVDLLFMNGATKRAIRPPPEFMACFPEAKVRRGGASAD